MDHTSLTLETYDKVASLYQDKFMDLDLYNDTYDIFCRLIEKSHPAIFEIGCGPGNITRYLLSKRPDFDIQAIDLAPNMIQLAQKNNPTATFKVMDARAINTLATEFDAIIAGFCLPYLSKEESTKWIKDCSDLLPENGILYFSAIEGDYSQSGYETSSDGQHKMYIYYHQEDYLMESLEENNFELLHLNRKSYPKPNQLTATHIIFIAKNK